MISKTVHKRAFLAAVSSALLLCLPSTAPADPPDGYYDPVVSSDPVALRTTLHQVIDDHTRFPYTSGSTDTWDILNLADEDPNDSGNILDVYKSDLTTPSVLRNSTESGNDSTEHLGERMKSRREGEPPIEDGSPQNP